MASGAEKYFMFESLKKASSPCAVRVKVSSQFCVRASTVQLTWTGLRGFYPSTLPRRPYRDRVPDCWCYGLLATGIGGRLRRQMSDAQLLGTANGRNPAFIPIDPRNI